MKRDMNLIRNILKSCIDHKIYIVTDALTFYRHIELCMDEGYIDRHGIITPSGREFCEEFSDEKRWISTLECLITGGIPISLSLIRIVYHRDDKIEVPPVEERQFRECNSCFAFVSYSGKYGDLCGIYQHPIMIVRGSGDGCLLHSTAEEMLERVRKYEEIISAGE